MRGLFLYRYVALDIWRRRIALRIESERAAEHAQATLPAACERERACRDQFVIHCDTGSYMRAATLLAFCLILSILASCRRPSVSNDSRSPEAAFRTAKRHPQTSRRPFGSLPQAGDWMTCLVT